MRNAGINNSNENNNMQGLDEVWKEENIFWMKSIIFMKFCIKGESPWIASIDGGKSKIRTNFKLWQFTKMHCEKSIIGKNQKFLQFTEVG